MSEGRLTDFRFARRFRSMNRTLQILLSLTLLAGLNFLAANYFGRFDLTESGRYTLAAESKAYIRDLDRPVEIIVTMPKDPEKPELRRIQTDLAKLLREYEAHSRKDGEARIDVEFVDIYRQRKRAEEIANQHQISRENVILVTSGDRSREIRHADLYEVKDGEIRGFLGEKVFTSAIIDVATRKAPKIYFLVGHGEMRLDDADAVRGLSQLHSFLRERNHTLATLDLTLRDKVPDDADLVVIPSPQAALLPREVEKLRRYMSERNGRMIVLIDPGRKHGLDELFYDWGVLADDMAVYDSGPDYKAQGGDLIVRRFAQHPITDLLIQYQITALFGLPRPVRIDPLSVEDERLQVDQLIGTSEKSWAERDFRTEEPPDYDPDRDLKGPISIATVSTRSAGSELGITIPGGRMVVFGNSAFIANNRLQALGNRTLFMNSLNWALDRTRLLNIETRPLESYQLVLSDKDLRRMLLYFGALPGVVAVFGFLVFLVRRR